VKQHTVIMTRGGVPAMFDRATGEVMHPEVGPLVEVERLYISPSRLAMRLCSAERERLVVLDAGLGAGSNAIAAWRTARESSERTRQLELISIDRTVEALEVALEPEHAAAFGFDEAAAAAARMLLAEHRHASPHADWRLQLGDLETELAHVGAESVDVVFWDPYSPRAEPALWSLRAFHALRRICRAGATVHTYSGATATRTALLLAGFSVGYGPSAGEKQKRSTIAAVHHTDLTQPLDRSWLEALRPSPGSFPIDAPSDALTRLKQHAQFQ
jgi:queuine tRNA-ribosyltransferase